MATAIWLVSAVALALVLSASAGPQAPQYLRLEYRDSPQGIDVQKPRFSWQLVHSDRNQGQTQYQIQVMNGTGAIFWDSGATSSNKSTNVRYAGPDLLPDEDYTWQVRYWDTNKEASPWSKTASFSTAFFSQSAWKDAQWIGGNSQLRTTFTLTSTAPVRRAVFYGVGLGYYKLYVNGQRVSDHELGPFTTYTARVYYDTYDVTEFLKDGSGLQHAVGFFLGNGWYSQPSVNVGKPSAIAIISISFADGKKQTIVTNTKSWNSHPGPVTMDDIYNGETYNASMEVPGWTTPSFDDSAWAAASSMPAPSSNVKLTSHAILPPIRIGQTYSPCNMWESSPGVYVFDFCQNMAGFTTLRVPAGLDTISGTPITQLHAEAIHGPPPAPIYHHYSNTNETTVYLTRGDGSAIEYTPFFTYMGFRYVQLTNYPGTPDQSTLSAHFVHTDYELIGDVSFSDPDLDGVQHITRAAAMSNFQSIPTDCPQRERRGWLGDAQLSTETNIHNFFMAAPYTSFVQQINDAQDNSTGSVQDCVPWYNHGHQPADPAWGSAYTFIADWVRQYYDDADIFENHYNGIKFHLQSLINQAKQDNIDGLLGFSWWGDWCPPEGCRADGKHHNSALVSSFMYLKQIRIMAEVAAALGKSDDAKMFASLDKNVSAEFNNHFYDAQNKIYRESGRPPNAEHLSVQTCISLAADLGLIPQSDYDEVIDNLVKDVMDKQSGHLDNGIVGIKYLLPTLSKASRGDVALQIAQTPTQPSWVYMVQQGATTLWETWTGTRYQPTASWNHIMFGSQSAWYFQHLAGIQMETNTRGFQNILIQPDIYANKASICANLSYVDASMQTPRGRVSSSWACAGTDGLCGVVNENEKLTLSCESQGGGTIDKIVFASFGTPTGSCQTGFKRSNCSASDSMDVVQKMCVGKSSCTIDATDSVFTDPCYGTPKQLAVSASGCNSQLLYTHYVHIPVGSTGRVVISALGYDPSGIDVEESGKSIFSNGKYKPGVPGILSAVATDSGVDVTVGSGIYKFVVNHSK